MTVTKLSVTKLPHVDMNDKAVMSCSILFTLQIVSVVGFSIPWLRMLPSVDLSDTLHSCVLRNE